MYDANMDIEPRSSTGGQTQTQRNGRRPKILIVDDEPRVLRSLQAALKSRFDIFVAQEATQAKQAFDDQEDFDVIVSDERMPQCTGLELLKWSRDSYPDCVRILLSSIDFSSRREAIRSADIYRCVSKPWDTQEFFEVLERAVMIPPAGDRRARGVRREERRAVKRERRSGFSRHSSLVLLDRDKTYRDEYKQIVQETAELSEIYYHDSAEEVLRNLQYVTNIGVLVVDLSIGESIAAELIHEINRQDSRIMIIVTSNPHSISNFMPKVSAQTVYDFIAKPLSARRIQSVVADALQQHFIKMRKH